MRYKVDVENKLTDTQMAYSDKYPDKVIKLANKMSSDNSYSSNDELIIIEMLQDGFSYKDVAESLQRSYYGLYDKVRRMKIEGKIY